MRRPHFGKKKKDGLRLGARKIIRKKNASQPRPKRKKEKKMRVADFLSRQPDICFMKRIADQLETTRLHKTLRRKREKRERNKARCMERLHGMQSGQSRKKKRSVRQSFARSRAGDLQRGKREGRSITDRLDSGGAVWAIVRKKEKKKPRGRRKG